MKVASSRIGEVLRGLPVPQPKGRVYVTVRETTLPEPRKLAVGEYVELGPRSGICGRRGGRRHAIRFADGRVEWIHTGDWTAATAYPLLARLARGAGK